MAVRGHVTVTERKAAPLGGAARTFLQRGREAGTCIALREAHVTAADEVTGRLAVRPLVLDMAAAVPPAVRCVATRFAVGIGVTL